VDPKADLDAMAVAKRKIPEPARNQTLVVHVVAKSLF